MKFVPEVRELSEIIQRREWFVDAVGNVNILQLLSPYLLAWSSPLASNSIVTYFGNFPGVTELHTRTKEFESLLASAIPRHTFEDSIMPLLKTHRYFKIIL